MALVIKDRIKETSTTTGTGTLTLAGASTGFKAFSEIGSGNTTYYAISDGTDWEVGLGTVGSGTLSRDTILASSNAGSAVSWNSDVKDVFCTYPADKAVYLDASGNFNISGGDITFGDNDKAIFGAGSDLQIYHDGGNSYIRDGGTGDLVIRANNLKLQSADNQYYLYSELNAQTQIYYDNSVKLATTSTGIDVTGTVTADTLSLNEASDFGIGTISSDTNWGMYFRSDNVGGSDPAIADFNFVSNSSENRLRIANNGDISFYEDTGTTPKFFWDASAESLGIGTSDPSAKLHLQGAGAASVNTDFIYRPAGDNINNYQIVGLYNASGSTSGAFPNQSVGFSSDVNGGFGVSGGFVLNTDINGGPLIFGTSNTERMRIDSSGNVGIGVTPSTTSAGQSLQIDAVGSGLISIGNTNLYLTSSVYYDSGFKYAVSGLPVSYYAQSSGVHTWHTFASGTAGNAATGGERMRIDSSGNVGIGTSSPDAKLHVQSSVFSPLTNERTTSGYVSLDLYNSFDDTLQRISDVNGSLVFQQGKTSPTERMRIDSSGRVGIGTSSPSVPLHVNGSNGELLRLSVTSDAGTQQTFGLGFATGATNTHPAALISAEEFDASDSRASLLFYTRGTNSDVAATERMRIDSSGNVGIGTSPDSTPSTKLHIREDDSTDYKARMVVQASDHRTIIGSHWQAGVTQYSYIQADNDAEGWYGAPLALQPNGGNVGIGTNSPSFLLDVKNGTSYNATGNWLASVQQNINATGYNGLSVVNAWASTTSTILEAAMGWNGISQGYYPVFTIDGLGQAIFAPQRVEAMRINSSGNVGIGTSSPTTVYGFEKTVKIESVNNSEIALSQTSNSKVWSMGVTNGMNYNQTSSGNGYDWQIGGSSKMRIDSSGGLAMVKTDPNSLSAAGFSVDVQSGGLNGVGIVKNNATWGTALWVNRLSSDGTLIEFAQASISEGSISVSGSTVSYNGGHLSRWSQLPDDSKDETIVKGTVMTNLDVMCEWSHPDGYWTEDDELPVDEDGNPTAAVGDLKKAAYTEDNEQLNRMAVSSVEGDTNVAGVFVNWDNDDDQFNDMNIAMTGDMVIRIAQGVTVNRGDLLMSAGDGTAKPQEDDIVRSKTIAKVTSTHVSHTYDDGSYLVPCVLMAC